MLVLHGALRQDGLVIWCEAPAEARGDDEAPGGRESRREEQAAPPLVYDAGRQFLSEALTRAGLAVEPDDERFGTAVVWLPSRGREPVPSTPLIAEPPASRAKLRLAPWTVTVFSPGTSQAIEFLCKCVGTPTLAAGVVVGRDLACCAQALRFAGSLVARQQYLPGVVQRGSQFRAVWEPVFAAEDTGRLSRLAQPMPGSARAISYDADRAPAPDGDEPPATPADVVLRSFIGDVVDVLVRNSVDGLSHRVAQVANFGTRTSAASAKSAKYDSLHDQWVAALRSAEGFLDADASGAKPATTARGQGKRGRKRTSPAGGDPSETPAGTATSLVDLVAAVAEWRRPLLVTAGSPFQLCFRLEEPPERALDAAAETSVRAARSEDAWNVRFLLQAADDPSLLVPTSEAWRADGRRESSVFKRNGFDVREYLLSSLGQASGICAKIEDSLKTSTPNGYALDATGAHEFLSDKALVLRQAGFGVMLPSWWTGTGTKLRLAAEANVKSPLMKGGGGLTLDAVVQFDWRVALGDQTLTAQELKELARLKAPLVQVRGQWVQVTAEEIEAALNLLKKKSAGSMTAADAVQLALGVRRIDQPIEFAGVTASGWVAELLDQLEGRAQFDELQQPEGLRGQLRPYQLRGYSWLSFIQQWGLGACLADDMGLGKTIQTLALIVRNWTGRERRPTLLVCPTSVLGNWQKEAERFTPELPVLVHHGADRLTGAAFQQEVQRHAIVLTSYSLLHRDVALLKSTCWAGVVLDEAQNIKNPETKQSQAARSLDAPARVALTGTPVENNVGDLWAIMEFLNPGFLGSQSGFKKSFFIPIQAERDPQAAARLKKLTGPFILRRLKSDSSIISDLPDKLEMKVFCTLTKEQASLYQAVVEDAEEALNDSDGIQRKGLVLATLMKLKQVCNHPRQFLHDNSPVPGRSGKLARLTEMLEEVLSVDDKALVFSQFTEMGDILKRHLEDTLGREVLYLHGGVPKHKRDQLVERFQSGTDGPPVMLLSLKAGGTGLNLTRANHVFHFDRWWNPAVENQATDRAFRIGQTKNVQVHKFVCIGTLEERIDEMIERKREVADQVVGTGEGWLTELSNTELKELFALRETAVE